MLCRQKPRSRAEGRKAYPGSHMSFVFRSNYDFRWPLVSGSGHLLPAHTVPESLTSALPTNVKFYRTYKYQLPKGGVAPSDMKK